MHKENIISYPVYFKKDEDGYFVSIPDLKQFTQGKDLLDAINMARDLISIICITYEDEMIDLPEPGLLKADYEDLDFTEYDFTALIDANLTKYRIFIDEKISS